MFSGIHLTITNFPFLAFPTFPLWTPGLGQKGPIKSALSILTSVHKFSRNWRISFFWNLAWCYGPIYNCVWQSRIFLKKIPIGQKWPKMVKNDPKTWFLDFLRKSRHVRWKFLWFINILRKLHAWEKSGSQIITKKPL